MILTINANAAVDHVLFVESLDSRGTIRASSAIDCIGGKGADAALALSRLGAPHKLISFAAGAYGQMIESLYLANAIQYELVWVPGETRVVTVIVEKESGQLTQISHPGYSVSAADCSRFMDIVSRTMPAASYCIAAGSLPRGMTLDFYQKICIAAHDGGAQILIDSSGEALLSTMAYHPDIIKLNRSEYQSTFGFEGGSLEDLTRHANVLRQAHQMGFIVITLGEDGLLAISHDRTLHASLPKMRAVNPAGAGDAVSAALAFRLSLGETLDQALRWGCAAGAAAVQTQATADFSLEDVSALVPKVHVQPIVYG